MTVTSISAVTLATAGMARAVAFYRDLGFRIAKGGPEATFSTLEAGGQSLNLTAEAPPAGGWWGRVIFQVDDVDALFRQAVGRGLHPHFEPRDAPWGERHFHITDPDGHELSFMQPL